MCLVVATQARVPAAFAGPPAAPSLVVEVACYKLTRGWGLDSGWRCCRARLREFFHDSRPRCAPSRARRLLDQPSPPRFMQRQVVRDAYHICQTRTRAPAVRAGAFRLHCPAIWRARQHGDLGLCAGFNSCLWPAPNRAVTAGLIQGRWDGSACEVALRHAALGCSRSTGS